MMFMDIIRTYMSVNINVNQFILNGGLTNGKRNEC